VLLSRDLNPLTRQALRRAAFVRGQHPNAALADFNQRFGPTLQPRSPRLVCGGTLMPVSKARLASRREPGTLPAAGAIIPVPSCGHGYGQGAHDAKLPQVVRAHS
jgi:uncharacterized protein with PIN domain